MQPRPSYEQVFVTTGIKAYLAEFLQSIAESQMQLTRNGKNHNLLIMPHGSPIVSLLFTFEHLRPNDAIPIEKQEISVAIPYTPERHLRRGSFYLGKNRQKEFQVFIKNMFFNGLFQYINKHQYTKAYTQELIIQYLDMHKINSLTFDTAKKYLQRYIEQTCRRSRTEPDISLENFSVKNNIPNQGTLSLVYS